MKLFKKIKGQHALTQTQCPNFGISKLRTEFLHAVRIKSKSPKENCKQFQSRLFTIAASIFYCAKFKILTLQVNVLSQGMLPYGLERRSSGSGSHRCAYLLNLTVYTLSKLLRATGKTNNVSCELWRGGEGLTIQHGHF